MLATFIPSTAKPALRYIRKIWQNAFPREDEDAYLASSTGVIHVGANIGQERHAYAAHQLPVIWIEPIAEQFKTLQSNIATFPGQIAINALISDKDDAPTTLHVSNNDGRSSSIFDLHQHADIWPSVHYVNDVEMRSSTLGTALNRAKIDITQYDTLVLDTQGSELLILRGAESLLEHFRYLKTEAADFEPYKGCATVNYICSFLRPHGFQISAKNRFATHPLGGSYFDLLFANRSWCRKLR